MCVQTETEVSKCDTMRRAAYSRDIRPELECVQERDCLEALKSNKADLAAVHANNYKEARDWKLKPIVYESYSDVYVVVVDPQTTQDIIMTAPM